ncbi:MAG: GDP-L-fucose synthase [Thermodesulfobacteriota bacterium]|nr:GDP-L-fucose synthase [Thermodesulfobacteriota bacterium]
MNKNSSIYIAGHTGLVGSALFRSLETNGYSNLIVRNHSGLDLTKQVEVEAFFQTERPEYVFLAAAKVGGIMANFTYPAEFIYTNLAIQNNIIHAAWKTGVKRLLFLGSSCIYPKECPQPMKEDYLLTGTLEPTNEPYAIAKIAGIKMCQSYNRQYGTQYICVMPTNLYGPNDNFDLETSHVLPALIRKFHLAKLANQDDWEAIKRDEHKHGTIPEEIKLSIGLKTSTSNLKTTTSSSGFFVPLWGSGNPKREFLHVDDLADACIFLTQMNEKAFNRFFDDTHTPLINIGCGKDQTVKEIAAIVAEVVGYNGDVRWDQDKPDGTLQKLLDISKIKELGWKPNIALKDGIRDVYEWYLKDIKG